MRYAPAKTRKRRAGKGKAQPHKPQPPHYIEQDEADLLQKLGPKASGPVFTSVRDGTSLSVSSVQKLIAGLGRAAGMEWPIHAHMLRHSCGFAMLDRGMPIALLQRWLGHSNIRNTVHYAETSETAFTDWRSSLHRARRHK